MHEKTVGRPMEILLVEDSLSDAQLTIAALRRGDIEHRLPGVLLAIASFGQPKPATNI